jgi:hypothetical protein
MILKPRVKLLCETVGKDGGWVPNGGGHIPDRYQTRKLCCFAWKLLMSMADTMTGSAPEPVSRKDDPNLIVMPDLPEPQVSYTLGSC